MTGPLDHLALPLVFEWVLELEPCTVTEVAQRVCPPECRWPHRGTVRNRLDALVDAGELIVDEARPAHYAVNHLTEQYR